jgi:hypothetical protein
MSGTDAGETVECPICEVSFDPTTAGGWCTNPDCGEWQYDDGDEATDDDVVYSPTGDPDRLGLLDRAARAATTDDPERQDGDTEREESDGTTGDERETAEVTADESGVTCPDCGATNDGDANFCMSCGTTLAPAADTVPESLVLEVCGRTLSVTDGERVGREVRGAMLDAGRPDDDAVRIHREHVRFHREDDGFYLVDLGDNPTRLNDRLLEKGDRQPVAPGDELGFSEVVTATVRHPENPTD